MLNYFLEHNRFLNIFGILAILILTFIFSNNRRSINIKLILRALLFQFLIALFILKTEIGFTIITKISAGFTSLYDASEAGIQFLFGNLANSQSSWGFIFAIKVLPIIIFFGAFMALLFYLNIIQVIVKFLNKLIKPILGTTGAETLCAISNSFLGQTEAPLLIRHYLAHLTKSEFLVVMISGMGSLSGAIIAVYALMGVPIIHLLTSSVMAIPSTIIISKILFPETEKSNTSCAEIDHKSDAINIFDAISKGTIDGLYLALNVGAMLIAFLSLLALINNFLFYLTNILSLTPITLDAIFGFIFLPFGYLLGFTGTDSIVASKLIGLKVAVNELVAYDMMLKSNLTPRAIAILTYALAGFSNFSCIGIQIGGIGSLVPERRAWLSSMGLKAVFGATLANLLSAMIAALII